MTFDTAPRWRIPESPSPDGFPPYVQTEPACQLCGDRGALPTGDACECVAWPAPSDALLSYETSPF